MSLNFSKLITSLFFIFLGSTIYSQNDSIEARLVLKNHLISENTEFIICIKLYSKFRGSIFVQKEPIITDYNSDFGDIQFAIEVLDSGCYKRKLITYDPFGIQFEKKLKKIGSTETLLFDIRRLYRMQKGNYRLRVKYFYFRDNEIFSVESNWLYFEVMNNRYPRLSD